jgi:hypothetical protein
VRNEVTSSTQASGSRGEFRMSSRKCNLSLNYEALADRY